MIEGILELFHYGTIMLFGIYLSAAFLGIMMNRRNVLILLGFSAVLGAINTFFFIKCGVIVTEQVYPLIIHLPLVLFLIFFYRYKTGAAVVAVTLAYLCCQLSNWAGILFYNISHLDVIYYGVRIVTTAVTFIVLFRFLAPAMAQLLQKPTKAVVIFGIMPMVYYVYDYAVTVYTALLYSGVEVITEFLGCMLCVFYLLFLVLYFKQYEEKRETEQRNQLMEMQRIQSEKEVEMMKRSQYEVSVLRHDMRHFLKDIDGFLENNEKKRAQEYIHDVIAMVDKTVTKKYCNNKIVNMILSVYEGSMKEKDIDFQYDIELPTELKFADSDISSILSNGLENAVHAVAELEQKNRRIHLEMRMHNDKLLISIKNTYGAKPVIMDGLPQTQEPGHGFGTRSIRYMTEKLKGNCQFLVDETYFILRIVL